MSLASFLFNGQAPKSVTTYGTTTEGLPQWFSDYQQGIAGRAASIAQEPFTPYGGPRLAAFNSDQNSFFNKVRGSQGATQPGYQNAVAMAQGAGANTSALSTSQPWLDKSGTASYDTVGRYMSPYQDAVVNRLGELGARNLRENLMPAINSDFIRAGQYGSDRQMGEIGRALRDTQESVIAEQNKALQSGYGMALEAANTDASRWGQIGQTAGQMSATDTENQISAASKTGALSSLQQEGLYRDADALASVGATQQGQTQKNLDLGYNDFLEQRDWDKTQLGYLNNTIKGFQMPMSSATSNQQLPGGWTYGASPVESALGSALQVQQLLK